ncbi:MAG: polyprenyl synthetase family protein, partial [Limnobacter sp.]|nr:polyprenyl synthetase family protein [Limnobacter sp.]
LGARAFSGSPQQIENATSLAAIVEFIHTATLLHDDVVDESEMRRGRLTANAEYGNSAAVLVGDFLYSRSFQMMTQIGLMPVMQVLADTTNTIAEGEVLQLLNCKDPDVTEARYMQVIDFKTAKLFEASGKLAGIVCEQSQEIVEAMGRYGAALGSAFQLIDDVLDYEGDPKQLGKNVGDDLREGKPTLPLIYALTHGSENVKQLIRQAIKQGGTDQILPIVQAIRECGALTHTRQQAEARADQARQELACLPENEFKLALADLCSLAVKRHQ